MSVPFPSSLSNAEWSIIEPLLPVPGKPGRPRVWTLRLILDGIFSSLRTGCAWRSLPDVFPPWQTVYSSFRVWRLGGVWKRLNTALRERIRVAVGRDPQPSAGI